METLKSRLQRGESVNICAIGRMFHHNLVQMIGMSGGFQGFWFDLEHTGMSIQDVEIGAAAARAVGLDCFVRIAPTDYGVFSRCLETGASGVMAAQVHSVEQAREIVQWCKFFPAGRRGMNNGGFDAGFGKLGLAEYCESANRNSLIIIQIESGIAAKNADEILSVPGVDMLFVGPADLSQSLGVPGDFMNPKCLDAMDQVSAASLKHGKPGGVVPIDEKYAELCYSKGCRMFSNAADFRIISLGLTASKQKFPGQFTIQGTT
jgi:4-hydroxy-2-oxoheptanedioate aldolase